MTDKPLVVLVNGAPGSGKTTLAGALSRELALPHLSKDLLVKGVWRTRRRASELGPPGVELFYTTMEAWLALGISFVADHTFPKGIGDRDVRRRLGPRGLVVNVHCHTSEALARWEERMRADPLCGQNRLERMRPVVVELQAELGEPLDFGGPGIAVETTHGYRPTVGEIVRQIDDLYGRPRVHDLDLPPCRPKPDGPPH